MDAQQVINKILADAQKEADQIIAAAKQQQADEQKKFDKGLAEFGKETQVIAQKRAQDEKDHILAAARMAEAKELLTEKRKVLDEMFVKSKEKLSALDEASYKELMAKLMAQASETGDEEVLIGANEKHIDAALVSQVNNKIGSGKLTLSNEKINATAGFVLRKGRVRTNVTVDVLIEQAREKLEVKLAKELFG
ncbi:MAG: V-type ATP synthase subunit E [Phycisphaerae bacterium]|nr:V-type ATP synthase subunit E [Phycisphaerae bacterium]